MFAAGEDSLHGLLIPRKSDVASPFSGRDGSSDAGRTAGSPTGIISRGRRPGYSSSFSSSSSSRKFFDARLETVWKAIVLSLLACLLFSLLARREFLDIGGDRRADEVDGWTKSRSSSSSSSSPSAEEEAGKLEKILKLHFDDPSWLLPVGRLADGSLRAENVSLERIVDHLEGLSDCGGLSVAHAALRRGRVAPPTLRYLNSGWTKTVYSYDEGTKLGGVEKEGIGRRGGGGGGGGGGGRRPVAVKTVNPNGENVLSCFRGIKDELSGKAGSQRAGRGDDLSIVAAAAASFGSADARMLEACRSLAKMKMIKEAYLMSVFESDNVVKLHDVCFSWDRGRPASGKADDVIGGFPSFAEEEEEEEDRKKGAEGRNRDLLTPRGSRNFEALSGLRMSYSTQLGGEADLITLLQLSWEDRLRICYGISKLLSYFSSGGSRLDSPVLINDFRRQQFVLVDGDVMLTDLDDLTFEERPCRVRDDCRLGDEAEGAGSKVTECVGGRCLRWQEVRNALSAGAHFVSVLLPHGVPDFLRPLANEIVNNFSRVTWRADENQRLVEKLVRDFSDGVYLERIREGRTGGASNGKGEKEEGTGRYKVMEGHDQPGQFDYRCRYTRGAYGCTLSVHDELEAEALCDADEQCRGFVMSPVKSWTGRRYAHLKSNFSPQAARKAPEGFALYYKAEL